MPGRRGRHFARLTFWGCALPLLLSGCVGLSVDEPTSGLRISELPVAEDPVRRASTRLVLEGLATDGRRAQGLYERALQVDSSNPYAYLALARHHVDAGESRRALDHLRRAEDLLRAYDLWSPRAEVQVAGLRGAALLELGRDEEAAGLLGFAARRDPPVWGDGHLSASELR
jgi:tetratricopeptide (TPR) repeat protein